MVNGNKLILLVLTVLWAILWGSVLSFSPFGAGLFFSVVSLGLIWILFFKRPLLILCLYFLIIVNLNNFVLTDNPVGVTVDIVLTSFLMVVIIFFFLVRKGKIEYAPLHIFYSIALIPCFISIFVSINPFLSVKLFFRFVSYLLISLGIFNTVKDRKDVRKILTFMALSAVIPCLFGYLQYFKISSLGIVKYSGSTTEMGGITTERVGSTLSHPVFFGLFLTTVTPITINLFQTVYKEKRLLFGFVIFALISSTILSLARAPWVALSICLMLYCIFMRRIKTLCLICCTILLLYWLPVVQARWAGLATSPQESSIAWRIDLWRSALDLFSSKWQWVVWGTGINTFADVSEMLGYTGYNAHNDYMARLVETGICGLLLHGLFLFYVLFALWKIWRKLKDPEFKNLVAWALSLHIAFLFFRMSNCVVPSVYVYYCALITLAFKVDRLGLIGSTGISNRTVEE